MYAILIVQCMKALLACRQACIGELQSLQQHCSQIPCMQEVVISPRHRSGTEQHSFCKLPNKGRSPLYTVGMCPGARLPGTCLAEDPWQHFPGISGALAATPGLLVLLIHSCALWPSHAQRMSGSPLSGAPANRQSMYQAPKQQVTMHNSTGGPIAY